MESSTTSRTAGADELLERSEPLEALAECLTAVLETGRGKLALVHGEAGIGKTSLVRRFVEDVAESHRVLWGKCDELFTPRPLGPWFDVAAVVDGRLTEVLEGPGTPYEVAAALAGELAADVPTVLVVEDAHLGDEATLDVLRILGVRAEQVPALMIVTYRDDELDRWHPLRIVLGEVAAASRVRRLKLSPLSPEAVALMAADHGILGEQLYRKTGGNPFFVTEVLAAGEDEVPETVRDAVLGRVASLSGGARRLVDAVAVAPDQSELWLVEAVAGNDIAWLEEATRSGIVSSGAETLSVRHELARLAIEDAIPADRRQALHRRMLEVLADPPAGGPEPARLAHHAAAVGDAHLVLRFAPLAAAQAAKLGSHRQAASHYRRALRFAELLPVEERARLSARSAQEYYLMIEFAEAVEAQREAVRYYEELGNRRKHGAALTFLALLLWEVGSLQEGLGAAQKALELLEELPGRELVMAYFQMASLQLAAEDPRGAMDWARRAQALAERIDDPPSRLAALQGVGWVEFFTGAAGGLEKLVQVLDGASAAGFESMWALTNVIIVRTACRRREYELVAPFIREGLEYCVAHDFDLWRYYLLAWQAKVSLANGHWSEAAHDAQICLADPCPFARIHALVALALVRARRGDPDVWGLLDEGVALAAPRNELQWIAPVAIARAEAAWLEGRDEDAIKETELAYEAAAGTWWSAGLAYWRWRAGVDEPLPSDGEQQYRLEMAGEWAAASASWQAIGCPYEAAVALLEADDQGLRRALETFRHLGAKPAMKIAERRLRARGVRRVPRGPRPQTRRNPAGLTPRELEVLALVAEGLANAKIAEQLVVSERTVDHHVSAILGKLDVHTRGEAGAKAIRLGLTGSR